MIARRRASEQASDSSAPVPAASEPLYSCGAGSNMYYVNARGDLSMCALTSHRAANIAGDGAIAENFDRVWAGFGDIRKIMRDPGSPCHGCDLSGLCSSCPGFASLENGDEQSAVAWLCRSTHLKAHRMGIPHRCDIKHFVYTRPREP